MSSRGFQLARILPLSLFHHLLPQEGAEAYDRMSEKEREISALYKCVIWCRVQSDPSDATLSESDDFLSDDFPPDDSRSESTAAAAGGALTADGIVAAVADRTPRKEGTKKASVVTSPRKLKSGETVDYALPPLVAAAVEIQRGSSSVIKSMVLNQFTAHLVLEWMDVRSQARLAISCRMLLRTFVLGFGRATVSPECSASLSLISDVAGKREMFKYRYSKEQTSCQQSAVLPSHQRNEHHLLHQHHHTPPPYHHHHHHHHHHYHHHHHRTQQQEQLNGIC